MKSAYQIIRKPVITEKGLGVKENQGTLVFEVNAAATKTEVKEAVQKIFKVKVDSVRTANFVGKERRRGKFAGYRPDWKKAYVRLKAGEKMPEYAANIMKTASATEILASAVRLLVDARQPDEPICELREIQSQQMKRPTARS